MRRHLEGTITIAMLAIVINFSVIKAIAVLAIVADGARL